jgi:hypothetical protein
MHYLTKQTPPFRDGPLDVAKPQEVVNELVSGNLIFHHVSNHLRGTRAVSGGDTHFQVTRKIGSIVGLLAN